MNRTLIALMVLALALLGGWWLFRGGAEPVEPAPPLPTPVSPDVTSGERVGTPTPPAAGVGAAAPPPEAQPPTAPPLPPSGTPTPEPTPTQAALPATHTVRYTDAGYEPQTAEINAGDTVVFRNESTDTVWTASNPHPTHTTNAAFDELQASPPGGEYAFTFNQAGAWRYHNHLNPGHTGTIIVK